MKLIAKTLYGLEKVLAEELISLGASDVKEANRAVLFNGDKRLLYKINYCSRSALSVLMPVADFRIRSKDDLYKGGLKIEWERYLDPDGTFAIVSVVNSSHFSHSGYAALLLKDSVADYFRGRTGRRPSVDTGNPDLLINLHVSNDLVTISLDSSVVPLFKRGYRQEHSVAPMNEVLAAGILMLSGWKASTVLTDPMCGSGTMPIEAGLMARKIPPGKFRSFFGFERWRDFDEEMFDNMKQAENSLIIPSPVKIYGSDISEAAIEQSGINIERAGLTDDIILETADFRNIASHGEGGYVFMNPPYGQRLLAGEVDELYSMMGTTLKHHFSGNTVLIITSNKESLKYIGLKPKEKKTLFNGALECSLLKYEMYQGTKKVYRE